MRTGSTATDTTAPLPPISRLVQAAAILFCGGASISVSLQFALFGGLAAFSAQNTMELSDRSFLLIMMGVGGVVPCLLAGIYVLWHRTQQSVDRLARFARIVAPTMLAWALPLFFNWRVFRDDQVICAVFATLFGLALERAFRLSFSSLPQGAIARLAAEIRLAYPRLLRWTPAILLSLLAVGFGVYFSYFSILNHHRFQTGSFDLGIFDNMMWNLVRGEWFRSTPVLGRTGSHIQFHATFGAYLFAPFYALYQKAETLLVLQAVVSGAGVIPLYLLARRRLASGWGAFVLAYAYLIHGPLHGPIFYDFHWLTMAPFFVGWTLYFFETGRRTWLVVAWIAALLLREDLSAGIAMACFFYLICGDRPRWALLGGLLSAAYFILVKFVIMPAHQSQHDVPQTFTWIFSGLIPAGESGYQAVLKTIISNPLFTLKHIINSEKITYVLKMFAPVLFLPFRNSRAWIPLIPAALFTLLSTGYKPVYQTTYQYTSNWTAYLFFGAAVTLGAWRSLPGGSIRVASALCAIAITATALSYSHGAIFQRNTFRGGPFQVVFNWSEDDQRKRDDLLALIQKIPAHASVATTDLEAPHVSNRADCFTIKYPPGANDADFLLVRLEQVKSKRAHKHMKEALTSGKYGFIERRGIFGLWRKGHPHTRDREGAALVGVELP